MRKHILIVLAVLLLAVVLAGCGSAQIRNDWAGTNVPGRMAFTYSSFTGTEAARVNIEDNQTLKVDFDVVVTQGSLTLRLVGAGREAVWVKEFESDEIGWFEISGVESGRYTIEVQGVEAGGSFEVTW